MEHEEFDKLDAALLEASMKTEAGKEMARFREANKNNPNLEGLDLPEVTMSWSGFDTSEQACNAMIQYYKMDTNFISDGYHTFGELYEHRITNFIALCRIIDGGYPNIMVVSQVEPNTIKKMDTGNPVWRSKKHSDGELAFGGTWFVLGISKEKGKQITYHLPIKDWSKTSFAEELEQAPEWDGHLSKDVLERLSKLWMKG